MAEKTRNDGEEKLVLGEEKASGGGTTEKLPGPSPGTDINFPVIMKAGIILIVVAIVAHIAMWGMFKFFDAREKKQDPQLSPVTSDAKQVPPAPRLQITPMKELKEIQGVDEFYLKNYGWVDEKTGVVRIPIEDAKKLLLERYANTNKAMKDNQNVSK
jgi:hypothetical protein